MGFMVYQMDVKSAFLYGTIKEEVYVCQPLGFKDLDYPDKVDDIIFGSTNKDLCKAFEKLMKDMFQMSSMGELTFFLGLQVKQKQVGIFISQDKYVAEILRKFGLTDGKSASTPIDTEKPLLKDPDGEDVDLHTYRSMIGSLMYLTSSRPDIIRSSFVDPSQYTDDPNMPALEDITYLDDEEFVGTEAGFSNLETSILVFRNKKDERDIVVRNIARLVAHRHTQEEGIDYEEVFAPVAKIEAIRFFLAYDSFMGFMVYQMDVKSVFLYGTIEEKVYVCQPPEFEDPDYPDKVYKVVKALYGYIKLQELAFEKLMKEKFQMSSMGELTFFLGLQVKQKEDGIFISQDKYVAEISKKFGLTDGKSDSTPIDIDKPLLKDFDGKDVDVHTYSVDCLPNEEIFAKLARMGYEKPSIKLNFYKAFLLAQWKFLIHTILQCMSAKRTVWKEFSSSMASAVICLATGRKFKISKYIFDSLVRNMDRPSKFLMYPRFLQLMINAQVGDLFSHTTKYTSPALTQKVFANIRRVEDEDNTNEVSVEPTPPSPTPATPPPSQQEPIPSPPQAESAQPSSPLP
nr:putative ribonuclease H-like domain-containing protein [Tanacetum cinerariifolium]